MADNPLVIGMSNPLQNPSIILSNNTYVPIVHTKKKKMETKSGLDHQLAEATTPTSGPKPVVDVRSVKPPSSPSKNKAKARNKKESPPPSPVEKVVELEDLPPANKDNPEIIMKRLQGLMDRTQVSQRQLQVWDKKNGLPKSHSQTMVNSSRSRKQLQKGVILKKWNGDPLISPADGDETTSQEQPEKTNTSQEKAEEQTNEKQTNVDVNDSESSGGTASSETKGGNEIPSHKKGDDPNMEDPSEIFTDDRSTTK